MSIEKKDLEEVFHLVHEIQIKSTLQQALARGISAIISHCDYDDGDVILEDSDIFYIPALNNLNEDIAKEIENLTEQTYGLIGKMIH